MILTRRASLGLMLALAACGGTAPQRRGTHPLPPAEIAALVDRHADRQGVPRDLVHRIVAEESGYDPAAQRGPYWGLMQLVPDTARTMGYRGTPEGLLEADTNLTYGVRYLRGAWIVSGQNREEAVRWYRRGYYYEARRLGLLEETGLR